MSGFFESKAPPLFLLFSWVVTSEVNAVLKQWGEGGATLQRNEKREGEKFPFSGVHRVIHSVF